MNRSALFVLLATATAAVGAQAHDLTDNALVIGVEPKYENVSAPRQECRNDWVSEAPPAAGRHHATTSPTATAGSSPAREVTSCRTVSDVQSRVVGHRVDYYYRGQRFSTLMHEQPGALVPVRVSVEPLKR